MCTSTHYAILEINQSFPSTPPPSQVFDKAVDEPHYCSLYAQLCWELDRSVPNFEPPLSHTTTFRKLLLRRCEEEFAKRHQHLLAGEASMRSVAT